MSDLRAALEETLRTLEYLWSAENLNGTPVHQTFYDGDPLSDDVPEVIRKARAALNATGGTTPEPATPPNLVRNQDGTYHCQGCDGGDIDWHKPATPSEAANGGNIPATPPAPSIAAWPDWTVLANVIREVDGNHDLGAGELATRILTHPALPSAPPWPDGEEAVEALAQALHDCWIWCNGVRTATVCSGNTDAAKRISAALRESSKPTGGAP